MSKVYKLYRTEFNYKILKLSLPISRLKRSVNNFSDVIPHILNNNESKKRQEFDNSMFKCLVCFEDKKGSKCIKLLGSYLKLVTNLLRFKFLKYYF